MCVHLLVRVRAVPMRTVSSGCVKKVYAPAQASRAQKTRTVQVAFHNHVYAKDSLISHAPGEDSARVMAVSAPLMLIALSFPICARWSAPSARHRHVMGAAIAAK